MLKVADVNVPSVIAYVPNCSAVSGWRPGRGIIGRSLEEVCHTSLRGGKRLNVDITKNAVLH